MGDPTGQATRRGLWRPIILIVIVAAAFIAARIFGIGHIVETVRSWTTQAGWLGPLLFAAFYIIAVVAMLPGSAITVAAGALFGSVTGVIVVSIASTVGASLAFLISRHVARGAIASWLSGKDVFHKLDAMSERRGAVIVAITRLVPIVPFNLLNYAFGLTKVRFGTYVFWSWLCMLPGTVLYVVGADAVTTGLAQGRVPYALIGVIIVAAIGVGLLMRAARNKLKEIEKR